MASDLNIVTEVGNELRYVLNLSKNEVPKNQMNEVHMWTLIQETLRSHSLNCAKELPWLNLGANLSKLLRTAPQATIGALSESSSSSFRCLISESEFLYEFGQYSPSKEYKIDYARMRFAIMYFGAIRDFAIKSDRDCKSIFHVPNSMIQTLAGSSTSQVVEFCHANACRLHFELTCPVSDCARIAELVKQLNDAMPWKNKNLQLAKLIKSNHCAASDPFLNKVVKVD